MVQPVLAFGENGGLMLEALGPLNRLGPEPLFAHRYELRPPLGIYNVSLSRLEARLLAVLTTFAALSRDDRSLEPQGAEKDGAVSTLLDQLELFVYAAAEHVDDCESILKTLFESEADFARNRAVKNFKREIKWPRKDFSHLANAIKHHHQRLRLFLTPMTFVDDQFILIGFIVERVVMGVVQPDPEFHKTGREIISLPGFALSCLVQLSVISRFLAGVLEQQFPLIQTPATHERRFAKVCDLLSTLPLYTFDDNNPLTSADISIALGAPSRSQPAPFTGSFEKPADPAKAVRHGRGVVSYEGDGVTTQFKIPLPSQLVFLVTTESVPNPQSRPA